MFGITTSPKSLLMQAETMNEVEMLVAGADVNAQDKNGRTALMRAVVKRSKAICKLLELGADVNARDNSGRTALTFAAINDDYVVMGILINAGADLNDVRDDHLGPKALIFAASYKDVSAVEVLLNAGTNVDEKTNKGDGFDGVSAL